MTKTSVGATGPGVSPGKMMFYPGMPFAAIGANAAGHVAD